MHARLAYASVVIAQEFMISIMCATAPDYKYMGNGLYSEDAQWPGLCNSEPLGECMVNKFDAMTDERVVDCSKAGSEPARVGTSSHRMTSRCQLLT